MARVSAALRVYAVGAALLLLQLLRRCRGGFSPPVFCRQPDRVAVVTGGTDGIGYSTAKQLARLGVHVIIAGNNEERAQQAVSRIKEETLNTKGMFLGKTTACQRFPSRWYPAPEQHFHTLGVEFLYCNLASMKSIRQFVKNFKMKRLPLHVLVNNAGVMMVPQRKTEDGFEEHFGLNYLGHFLLTSLLLDSLKESGSPGRSSRVVTVSSATHYVGELNLEDLQSSSCYSPHGAYARSKLALVMFSYHLQRLLEAQGCHVTANVVDPGVVNTDLYKHVFWGTRLVQRILGWLLFKTPDEGAWTSVYAAVSPELEGLGGRYLYNEKETKSLEVTYDQKLQQQLWARSCQMTGVTDVTRGTILD
ncbi:PREDICTED: dehydrogenase/reductase SDR family member on chromosome X isoform X1 [Chinchilla lanigera]|uniref:dehydrogenase/reductase SDR family member on chromosome X isoform X1 n=1 Tax=Chinchilla lanigera TaxID=34839 RepID=UPI000695AEE9|nr:PREDICTED: dehydrogenase/reductase SDR family member on chromosome X isoform X1 [Chinchilla lanigera]